jgi:hypothetical protein
VQRAVVHAALHLPECDRSAKLHAALHRVSEAADPRDAHAAATALVQASALALKATPWLRFHMAALRLLITVERS